MASSLHRLLSGKQDRKLRKPLIERKRRERINNCLDKLKETVVGAFHLDQSKLEKADILEMTVKHLQNIQGSKMTDSSDGPEDQQKYSTGYIQCMHEVHNLLLTCEWMDKTLGARMLNHLLKSLPKSSEEAKQDPAQPSEPTLPLPATEDSLNSAREDKVDLAASLVLPCTTTATRLGLESPHLPAPSSACPSLPSASSQYNASLGAQDLWRPW